MLNFGLEMAVQRGPGAPVTENQRDLGQPVSPSVQESEMLSVPGSNVLRSPHRAAVSDGKAGSAGLALTSPQQLIVCIPFFDHTGYNNGELLRVVEICPNSFKKCKESKSI